MIGRFVWNPARLGARRRSVIGSNHLMVIPRLPVRIARPDAEPFVADPRCAVFYNAGQPYEAEQLVDAGEHSVFFGLDERLIRDHVGCAGRISRKPGDEQPLPFAHGPCDARSYLLQRQLVALVQRDAGDVDPMEVEEGVVRLASRLLASAFAARGIRHGATAPQTQARHRDAAEAARLVLLRRYREPLSLGDVADCVGLSAHHLCRIFRQHVGQSLHQYRLDLRLRAALEPLCEAKVSLAALALDLGFNSQSHFTTAFAGRFGCTPAGFRRDLRGRGHRRPSPARSRF